VPGKSPSHWRVVVIAGAGAVLVSAMTPVHAAAPDNKAVAKKRPAPALSQKGHEGPPSFRWVVGAALRP
jgi:hypothetical protein